MLCPIPQFRTLPAEPQRVPHSFSLPPPRFAFRYQSSSLRDTFCGGKIKLYAILWQIRIGYFAPVGTASVVVEGGCLDLLPVRNGVGEHGRCRAEEAKNQIKCFL